MKAVTVFGDIYRWFAALDLKYDRNLGLALTDSKDLPGAIAAFKKAVELNPKFALAHNQLGLVLQASKDLPGAIAAFKKAIEHDRTTQSIMPTSAWP